MASGRGKPKVVGLPTTRVEPTYPAAAGASPEEVAAELVEAFDLMDDWNDRYQYLIELGERLPPMPAELKTEATRVKGCQSTVHMFARKKPGTADVLEFLADSDADIVRGELALLQKLFSGQRAQQVLDFDIHSLMQRLGLDSHLSLGRRNGLAEMIQRIRHFAGELAGQAREKP
ncbi:MAG: SufE family protein [Gemmataceae bacterium]|nr:SufE family protein [Gemmataceae bacterium]